MIRLVSELTGADLALWVARAEKMITEWVGAPANVWIVREPDLRGLIGYIDGDTHNQYSPHEDWAQGGPIIERANISLHPPTSPVHRCGGPNAGPGQSGVWAACTWTRGTNGKRSFGTDDHSPLVAAMRCYVRYVFGDAVPDEVTP